jgi:SNF2 family DNA or RNA helicase
VVVKSVPSTCTNNQKCPVCYDGVPNPSIIIPCGHDTCAECLTKINDQAAQAGVMNGDEGGGGCKCPTCRGKVDMNKIIDYNTFKKVHLPGEVADGDDATAASDSDSGSDSNSDSDAGSDNSDGDLRNFIVPDDVDDDVDVETEDKKDKSDFDDLPDLQNLASQSSKKKTKSDDKHTKKDKKGKKKGKKQKKEKKGPKGVGIAYLKKMSKTKAGRKKYMRFLRKRWEPSAKTTKCVELLDQFQGEGRKTIVFSQFVSLLDLLQVPLEENGWGFERYDGGMSADERNDAINAFTDKPDCRIMLISLKAGNAGLNLVAASRVIILDPFWNPFIEMQAVDRAYRIGQQNAVEVHRILIQSTVEDRIIELQEKKRTLVNAALDETANKSLGRLGARELAYLFGVGGR